ncbi:MAG TPA: tRNA lysidine(34) synthetase TilS [Longimicrobiales bacterium]|nr:tRNA lysidine(34) synthetase TilS [Longimicrobiales bacterium]
MESSDLVARLRAHLGASRLIPPRRAVLVALSGGRDSVTLLHLLRFGVPDLVAELRAAHVDHRMRPSSGADARWVAGLCRAWDVPLDSRILPEAPGGEEDARRGRYRCLRESARAAGGALVATAHHADDQAETVLFRLARGSGPAGLVGIRERTSWLVRPLLPFTREDICRYARANRLSWREDETNRDPARARNALRSAVLPALERAVPGSAASLARFARLSAGEERAWDRILDDAEPHVVLASAAGEYLLARPILCSYDRAVRGRLLRRFARRLGVRVRSSALERAVSFLTEGASGKGVDLGGGVRLDREFERFRLHDGRAPAGDAAGQIRIGAAGPGRARLSLGVRRLGVAWTRDAAPAERTGPAFEAGAGSELGRFAADRLRYPLTLRAARPGDRIRLPYGRKRLAKLFAERGVPRSERASVPVLADADDEPLWVPGAAQAKRSEPREGEPVLNVRVWDERDD